MSALTIFRTIFNDFFKDLLFENFQLLPLPFIEQRSDEICTIFISIFIKILIAKDFSLILKCLRNALKIISIMV